MHYNFSTIAGILQQKPVQMVSDPVVDTLITDSRKLLHADTAIFFSLSSAAKNANKYITQLYDKGVRCFVTASVTDDDLDRWPEANVIVTEAVLNALQQLASFHRHKFNYPVIGITGSNGKTIVKEWLNELLHTKFNIVRSPKSFNSQLGVPLSIWQMQSTHTLAIFEAGVSEQGEMKYLESMLSPDIGIFTFAGNAHASGFASHQEKLAEKLSLFSRSKVLVYCADDNELNDQVLKLRSKNPGLQLVSWSSKSAATLSITNTAIEGSRTNISYNYKSKDYTFDIAFTDEASIHNAITCVCVLLHLGIKPQEIQQLIMNLSPVEMRLELKQGVNNCSIINDSYSSDIDSLVIALDFLMQQQQHPNRSVILSDMLQTGLDPEDLYKRIGSILKQKKLARFVGIGPEIFLYRNYFEGLNDPSFFISTDAMLENIPLLRFHNETILLKGARLFGFERISDELEEKKHETVMDINLNALRNNLTVYRKMIKPSVKMMAMVKAFSYGTGSFEIANVLEHAGIDYLAVAYADEGVLLRQTGIMLPIMVMNIEEAGFENLLKFDLQPELYSFRITYAFINFLKKKEVQHFPVHIKLDTGMHRLGFEPKDLDGLCTLLRTATEIKIQSVFSHLAASDDSRHDAFTEEQATFFHGMALAIEEATGYTFIKHIANTSAIHRHPALQLDMIRLGIGLYGIDANPRVQQHLKNVANLRTGISQIKNVKKGESVGYSRSGIVERDSVIATVRVGYADGYPRALGNGKGKMLVNGLLAPVVGNVCMDMTMLDITDIKAAEGDEVLVFGERLPVWELAIWANTISYEILTGISQRVNRIYFEE